MVRLAIVGAGPSAKTHERRIRDLPGTDVAGIAALDESFSLPDSLNTTHDNYEVLIEEPTLDGAILCGPPGASRGPATVATKHNLPFLRPGRLAGTLTDAIAIVDTVEETSGLALGGFPHSFSPMTETAVERATGDTLGSIGNVRLYRETQPDADGEPDLIGPDIEFLRRIGGEIQHVFGRRTTPDSESGVLTTVRLESGVIGHLDARRTTDGHRHQFEIAGTEGLLEYDSDDTAPVSVRRGTETEQETPLAEDAIARQVRHFRDCLRGDTTPRITVQDALSTLRAIEAVRESAASGVRVSPSEVVP